MSWPALFGLFGLLLLASCGVVFQYQEVQVGPQPFDDVWDAVVEVAAVDGYPVDSARTDRGLRVFESLWKTQAVPFRLGSTHRGRRRRVHAEFEQPGGGPGWLVRFYVERQVIGDMTGSLDPAEEHWTEGGQDVDTERRISVKLQSRFGVRSVSGPRTP